MTTFFPLLHLSSTVKEGTEQTVSGAVYTDVIANPRKGLVILSDGIKIRCFSTCLSSPLNPEKRKRTI